MPSVGRVCLRSLILLATLAASALAADSPLPSIVLITMDTTRADRMGFLGSERGLTPNLDQFARESFVFTHAYSQAPLTAPSHATILTGTYPQFHQVSDFQLPLSKDLPYAPAILKAHGYSTAAFLGAIVLDPAVELAVGFDRGFDRYDAGFHATEHGESRYTSVERRGSEVVERALAWLKGHPQGPFFLWVHLYDAHEPYDPPEPFKSKYRAAPYDGEIAYVDSVVGSLLGELKARGFYDGALIAVMADHGESLGAHGEESHGFFLYDETIHVPLLFKLPLAQRPGGPGERGTHGLTIDERVGLVDVLPTILQAVGIEVPKQVQGESLLGLARSQSADRDSPRKTPERSMYAETDYGRNSFGWSSLRSLRTGKYLFIEAPRRELYDQSADAAAANNLAPQSKAVADTLQGQLDDFRLKTSTSATAPKVAADPEAQAKLVALGYMASGSGIAIGAGGQIEGADPKDKIEVANLMGQANFQLEDWNFAAGIALLEKVVAKEPGLSIAYTKLAAAEMFQGHPEAAVKALRRVEELTPDPPNVYFNLGNALLQIRDYEGALAQYEILAAKDPHFWEAHVLLAMTNARLNRVPETIAECETVLRVAPEHYGTNLILGRFLLRQGNAQAAVTRLQKAASIRPQAFEPHLALAEAYSAMGLETDAARERDEAERLHTSPRPGAVNPTEP